MIALLCFLLRLLASPFKSTTSRLEAENAALRHQLIALRRKVRGRVEFTSSDRLFFILLALASRRDFVAGAVTVAAAAGTASGAQAQTPSNLRFSNPPGMSKPAGYSHIVEISWPHRTIYLAGQTGIDANGKVAEDFRAQAVQVLENIKTALASVGGGFQHVVKLTSYLTNLEANGAEFREVRASYFPNKTALPASTLLQISRLANPTYLVEVEVIAVIPRTKTVPDFIA